ncbi:MAG: ATP-binding protein [Candidatus Hatepunaea meridiana]|nr:ATP-binding protein [Candidatus Hatepunaea meridiana]
MINKIEIEGFKSLKKVKLKLGKFNLFIGTNASGKSNFFDALRVLQGIGYGYTFDEILNGKPKSATSEVWEGIRGGSEKASFISKGNSLPKLKKDKILLSVGMRLPAEAPIHFRERITYVDCNYSIAFSSKKKVVCKEEFLYDRKSVFKSEEFDYKTIKVSYCGSRREGRTQLKFARSLPILHQLLKDKDLNNKIISSTHRNSAYHAQLTLIDIQRFDPLLSILRTYSKSAYAKRMGDHGENFAALVNTIISDEYTKSAYLSWLKQLTPTELDDVTVLSGALGEPMFATVERGVKYPAPILSDGTLRFAAITAAFFQPDMPHIITIEEIENGIHPSRLRLLVELLKTRSSERCQVIATTHSPLVLQWLKKEDYETTFICKRDEETGASTITPLSEIPRLLEIIDKQSLGDLFTEGWLEDAL